MRNPWGSFEWKGTWGRKCLNWTENLKYKLQYNTEDDDDGTFWMSFKDMANYFNYVTIAHISPEDSKYCSLKIEPFETHFNYKKCWWVKDDNKFNFQKF